MVELAAALHRKQQETFLPARNTIGINSMDPLVAMDPLVDALERGRSSQSSVSSVSWSETGCAPPVSLDLAVLAPRIVEPCPKAVSSVPSGIAGGAPEQTSNTSEDFPDMAANAVEGSVVGRP